MEQEVGAYKSILKENFLRLLKAVRETVNIFQIATSEDVENLKNGYREQKLIMKVDVERVAHCCATLPTLHLA